MYNLGLLSVLAAAPLEFALRVALIRETPRSLRCKTRKSLARNLDD